MGKSASAEMEINKYFLSQHFGACAQADAVLAITIKEKLAWSGRVSTQSEIVIDRPDLFGSSEKEGGVEGVVHYLPGGPDQLLSNLLAQKLGRPSGASCPGFRGLASLFFTGPKGTANAGYSGWGDQTRGKRGFYWTANNPYLPGVWATFERAPKGLDPDLALIPRGAPTTVTYDAEFDYQFVAGVVDTSDPDSIVPPASGFDDTARAPFGRDRESLSPLYPVETEWLHQTSLWLRKSFIAASNSITLSGHVENGAAFFIDDVLVYDVNLDNSQSASASGIPYSTTLSVTPGAHTLKVLCLDEPENFGDNDSTYFYLEMVGVTAGPFDANPAHMIFECLTNTDWGMGSASTAIDVASFESAGVALYGEGFGLSMLWTRQTEIETFIREILDHINGVVFADPATGLLTLKLIRADYDPETLPEINPSNATLSNFGRKLWGEIVNEVVVTWTNPENEQDETAPPAQDLASIVIQGIVSDGRNYYGVRSAALAQRLAQRDLRAAGAPLASCEVEIDRRLWRARPASVFRVTWPEHGLNGVVMRVADGVDYGKPGDPTIKMPLIEDVYGLDVGDYIEPPGSIWEDPSSDPEPLEETLVLTLPYFLAVRTTVAAFIDSPEYPEVLAGVLGSTSNVDTFNYELWDEVAQPDSSLVWQSLKTENVIGRAELVTAFDAEAETTFDEDTDLTSLIGQTVPTQGGFMLIGDGTEDESEIALITAVGATITVSRGVLDTVPKAWPIGTPVWFVDGSTLYEDPVVRAAGEVVSYRMLTRTSKGLLDLADAPDVSYTLTERPWLPSRPANVLIDAIAFNTIGTPVDMIGESIIPVTWANRNRLTEDSVVLDWNEGDVTPETGQTTTITIYETDGTTVIDTITGLSGTSHDIPLASFGGQSLALVRLTAERTDDDGTFASLQGHGIWVQVEPHTFDSTLITFDSTLLTMDEG